MPKTKKGFTLIELLVVIAMIAMLVSILSPVINNSAARSQAAVDAANLRTVLGTLNVIITSDSTSLESVVRDSLNPASEYMPGAKLHVLYEAPGFVDVYFVTENGEYYGLEYLSDLSRHGSTNIPTTAPTTDGVWYIAGIGLSD